MEKEKGWLSRTFSFVVKAALVTIPIAFAANIGWQLLLDPTFFPWLHDPNNVMAQAMVMKMEGLRHAALWATGLEGDGPLSGVMQNWLAPEVQQIMAERTAAPALLQNSGQSLLAGNFPGM